MVAWSERRPASHVLLGVAAAGAASTALCIVAIDRPVARTLAAYEPSALWDRAVEILEWTLALPVWRFASSVALVVGMVVVMSVPRWRHHAQAWMVVAGTHVISRFLTGELKDATGRIRPPAWLAHGGDGETFWRDGVAFPSGHVVLFASIVIPLAVVAPRTRPLLAIAAYMMAARVAVNAHWVSDAVGAITLVVLVTWALALAVRPFRTD